MTPLIRFGFFVAGWLSLGGGVWLCWFGANLLRAFWRGS
jgi:hypothetical protein